MARICAACRQPVERDARDHDCPVESEPRDDGEDGPEVTPAALDAMKMALADIARRRREIERWPKHLKHKACPGC